MVYHCPAMLQEMRKPDFEAYPFAYVFISLLISSNLPNTPRPTRPGCVHRNHSLTPGKHLRKPQIALSEALLFWFITRSKSSNVKWTTVGYPVKLITYGSGDSRLPVGATGFELCRRAPAMANDMFIHSAAYPAGNPHPNFRQLRVVSVSGRKRFRQLE